MHRSAVWTMLGLLAVPINVATAVSVRAVDGWEAWNAPMLGVMTASNVYVLVLAAPGVRDVIDYVGGD